ncbi:SDR family oxidoreductase [Gallaecimonas pentaromativorans]|uniref:SDR family oxidoreductase n=1 Tax=Gallaecimonas pentaromativorans TaxID=584787 RepID=UPI003A94E5D9
MQCHWQDKHIVVTGAGGVIGSAICRYLVECGAKVTALDKAPRTGEPDLAIEGLDLTDAAAINGFGARLSAPVDGLVNNAAIAHPHNPPLAELPLSLWQEVLAVNLTAPMLMTQALLPHFRDGASVVNIASTRAVMSEPNSECYGASKGGLVALTHALAISLGPKVRVNCVSPGWVAPDGEVLSELEHHQHPAGRVGRGRDIASLVAWLLGPEAGFVTGQHWLADGGMSRKMIYS